MECNRSGRHLGTFPGTAPENQPWSPPAQNIAPGGGWCTCCFIKVRSSFFPPSRAATSCFVAFVSISFPSRRRLNALLSLRMTFALIWRPQHKRRAARAQWTPAERGGLTRDKAPLPDCHLPISRAAGVSPSEHSGL